MDDWSTEKLDDLMDRYVFGLLDAAGASRVRRKIESEADWQLAYEAAVERKGALVDGVRAGAAEAAATRAPGPDDVLAAAKPVEAKKHRRRLAVNWALAGLAAAATLVIGFAWLRVALVRPPVRTVRLVGQTRWLAGATVSLRALVTRIGAGGAGGVPVVLRAAGPATPRSAPIVLADWTTDAWGTAAGEISVPDWPSGRTTLLVQAGRSPATTVEIPITIRRGAKLYLATDKPIYQPGQTVHIRCMALRKPSLRPLAGEEVELSVTDPAGNIIFTERKKLSDYGIASADLPTDPLIRPGRYTVKAAAGDDASEQTIEIFQYKLPAFAVKLRLGRPYFLPAQTLTGRVEVRYHFGKPVAGGTVELRLTDLGIAGLEDAVGTKTVTTDADGRAEFRFQLPAMLHGLRRTHGTAHLRLSARATDTAGQENTGYATVVVAAQDIRIAVVSENGTAAPGGRVFIVTSYPDGRPAETIVDIESIARSIRTDSAGAAVISADNLPAVLHVSARDAGGRTGKTEFRMRQADEGAMVLRTDKPIYDGGETINVEVAAPGARQVFLDVIKDRQTMLTKTLAIENGRGRLALDIGAELVGTLQLHAYRLGDENEWVGRDTLIIVRPARRLRVTVTKDRDVYRPGRDAKLTFTVTDPAGRPVAAALSLAAVDEAVYSVQQAVPGLEQTLLGLDAELLKPAVEVHGFSPHLFARSGNYARAALAAAVDPEAAPRDTEHTAGAHSLDFDNEYEAWGTYRSRRDDAEDTAWGITVFGGGAAGVVMLLLGFFLARLKHPWLTLLTLFLMLVFFGAMFLPSVRYAIRECYSLSEKGRETLDPDDLQLYRRLIASATEVSGDITYLPQADSRFQSPTPRIRSYFPETMLWRPEVITDRGGRAELNIPLADSITTWRLSGSAVSGSGHLGRVDSSIRVFQPFFVEIDAPPQLTRGDEVSVPLVLYNYAKGALTVSLKAEGGAGLALLDGAEQTVELARGEVKRVHVRVRAEGIGEAALKVEARSGEHADGIRRALRVVPPGVPQSLVVNGPLTDGVQEVELSIPADAVPGSVTVRMKVYPSTFSELLDGLEGIFRMPYGCFEQTSSTTYPNVMALSYMQANQIARPRIVAKARRYIHTGYQRLLSFEVRGGGFSLYGESPANLPLTAYGLMEFSDMARVHNVDASVLARAAAWLAGRQKDDGSWSGYLPMSYVPGAQTRLAVTAYVTWALAGRDPALAAVHRGADYVARRIGEARDPHTLALCANALLAAARHEARARAALGRLAETAKPGERRQRYWSSRDARMAYSHGPSGDVETTALAALAMLQVPEHRPAALDALRWISARRDPYGTWGTTQATVLALKAMLAGSDAPAKRNRPAAVGVTYGRPRERRTARLQIRPEQSEAVHAVTLAGLTDPGAHRLTLSARDAEGMGYQFVVRYHSLLPEERPAAAGPIGIRVDYDRTDLRTGQTVRVRAVVTNNTSASARMLLVDIGTPPGFVVRPEGLEKLKAAGKIDRYTLTARGVIVYVPSVPAGGSLEISYEMAARMPLNAVAAPTSVYAYYNPEQRGSAQATPFVVR